MNFLFISLIFILLHQNSVFPSKNPTKYSDKNTKQDLLQWINVNKSKFQVGKDDAVFWAGKRRLDAEKWAIANGKYTKEMTDGGKWLEKEMNSVGGANFNVLDGNDENEIWDAVSKIFAELSSGNVHVFSTGTARINPEGTTPAWFRIEKPILMCNKNVQRIYRMTKAGKLTKWEMYKKPKCRREELLKIYGNEASIPENLRI